MGGLVTSPSDHRLESYLLSLCKDVRPRVCFLPTASGDRQDYQDAFLERFASLACEPSVLKLFDRDVTDIDAYLSKQHLILVGGGNTASLRGVWGAHHVDQSLARAWEQGVVLAGWSAGAICWFEAGLTDSYGPRLQPFREGLSLLKGSFCPHYDSEPKRRGDFEACVKSGELPAGYAADDGVALCFDQGELREVVSVDEARAGYRVGAIKGGVRSRKLKTRVLEGPQRAEGAQATARQDALTVVYTDGACSGNPGPGGWAWAVRGGRFASGAERHTTNQRMEVTAAYRAVLAHSGPIEVVSDSTYVVNCFKQRWWEGWLKRGWINSQRRPVANRDLWEPFIQLVRERDNVRFRWVKGHSEDRMNQFVDQLAVEASQSQKAREGQLRGDPR